MRIKGVSMEMTSDRREWKKKTCCADPDKGMMMLMVIYSFQSIDNVISVYFQNIINFTS
jgi:hypothetical protein